MEGDSKPVALKTFLTSSFSPVVLVGTKLGFFHEDLIQNQYFKPNGDVLQTLIMWVLFLNVTSTDRNRKFGQKQLCQPLFQQLVWF